MPHILRGLLVAGSSSECPSVFSMFDATTFACYLLVNCVTDCKLEKKILQNLNGHVLIIFKTYFRYLKSGTYSSALF